MTTGQSTTALLLSVIALLAGCEMKEEIPGGAERAKFVLIAVPDG